MRLLSRLLWLIAFTVATFCWFVLFEYGFGLSPFLEGFSSELARLKDLVSGMLDGAATPDPAPDNPATSSD
jgi:hypothetical protein